MIVDQTVHTPRLRCRLVVDDLVSLTVAERALVAAVQAVNDQALTPSDRPAATSPLLADAPAAAVDLPGGFTVESTPGEEPPAPAPTKKATASIAPTPARRRRPSTSTVLTPDEPETREQMLARKRNERQGRMAS